MIFGRSSSIDTSVVVVVLCKRYIHRSTAAKATTARSMIIEFFIKQELLFHVYIGDSAILFQTVFLRRCYHLVKIT